MTATSTWFTSAKIAGVTHALVRVFNFRNSDARMFVFRSHSIRLDDVVKVYFYFTLICMRCTSSCFQRISISATRVAAKDGHGRC
jgi:hypothetical protein